MLKKNPTIEEDTPTFPCEIIENILSRLSVKSLLRFKSVSKQWYSLISDAKFARSHLNQTKNSDYKTLSVCQFPRSGKISFLKFTNQNFQFEALEFPLKKYREATVLCSCDGLVLLKNIDSSRDKMCVLWNPATRTYTMFSCRYPFTFLSTYGLCYDASGDDYKFVLLISDTRYAVFSYKNNSWIEKEDDFLTRIIPDSLSGLFVNGALHWLATRSPKNSDYKSEEEATSSRSYENSPEFKCDYNNIYEICCFDPRDDKFKKLSKPSCFNISSVFGLTDLGGQLCLYRNTGDFNLVEIWMMKEYAYFISWAKLLTIENVPAPHRCRYVEPLCLINKTNIILCIYGLGFVVYNPKEDTFCEMDITGAEMGIRSDDNMWWNDSLVLPSRISRN